MSTPQPPRRRRIAGESRPGAPAPKPSVVKKAAAKARPPSKASKAPKAKVEKPAAPPAPPTTAEPRTRRFRAPSLSGRFGALVALTVASLAFGAVFGIRGIGDWRDDSGIVDSHDKATTAAASAAETIFTYQYNQLSQHLRESKKTMTPAFAKKFTEIAPALQELAPQRKIQVRGTVRNAAAEACGTKCSADQAVILVFIDQARVADGADKPTVFGNRIEVSMVKRDGDWLVNDIKAL